MKGIDFLINNLAFSTCPSEYDLKNVNYESDLGEDPQCLNYNVSTNSATKCKDCFRKAIELEYDESEVTQCT